ncbi:NAD-dependent epimerase/dehydratase family protein [Vibrio lentus]|uniref:Epimerase n=3 Tax=Vibrio lentus TaxID=136468 RepID=A0AA44VRN0_9VIBR|nr:NAD(P)-dependent oxidoreductase [Vibrio lentus]MCB5358422.1 NAD(P)-dependent oxidoreductase [Vibrio lentus]MCB5448890.1 NAD(P)-dependent oxidoreductase [Vibrio lentus]MCB5460777.1 NAD(P)-dependent oxidoreductase [Vibrio lentus]MCC4795151.1 NAD(P)-dependent oxidoreductase [Vibrio lentus]MCC4852284.1 NAD(P)-dependent oxidoreductase [Vibrio lentus]
MKNNYLIFGGSGFIGTHLCEYLIDNDYKVTVVDLNDPIHKVSGVEYIKHDVRDLSELNLSNNVSCIYNLAAVHTTPGHVSHEYYETNVLGAIEVTKFAERHGVEHIVFTSSISVYGPDEVLKDEFSELTPNSSYGFSKMLAEKVHKTWLEASEKRYLTIVRPAVVFGPGEGGNFTRLAKMLQKGVFIFPGRKDTIKSCIYVDDLLYLIEAAKTSENRFEILNGAYKERYSLENIVQEMTENHFEDAKTVLLPRSFVLMAAKVFKVFNFMNIGIHPERVMKLLISTNIYPRWVEQNEIELPFNLSLALKDWSRKTNGKFD